MQEVYFAKDLVFFCGDTMTTYQRLYYASKRTMIDQQLLDLHVSEDVRHKYQQSKGSLIHMRAIGSMGDFRKMVTILSFAKLFDATDPRDKVYGLMNLEPFRRSTPNLVPNYSSAIQDIYADAAVSILRQDEDLHILTLIDHGEDELWNGSQSFASWVPRLDRKPTAPDMSATMYSSFFSSGTDPSTATVSEIEYLPRQGHILRLKGLEFDTIEKVGGTVFENDVTNQCSKPLFLTTGAWKPYEQEFGTAGPYGTDDAILDAYARALTMSCYADSAAFTTPIATRDYIGKQRRLCTE